VADAWHFVADGLAMNYALTKEVIDYLGLLRDADRVMDVAGSAIEYPGMLEWNRLKKTAAERPAVSIPA